MTHHIVILTNRTMRGISIMMVFHAMGMNYRHDGEFSIDRPAGSGDELLLIFKTEARVSLQKGEVTAPSDSALLYTEGYPQRYRAGCKEYVNHFIHMDCRAEKRFLAGTGIPVNEVLPLQDVSEAEELMRLISREEMSDSPYKEQYMDMLIRLLLLKIGDGFRMRKNAPAGIHSSVLGALRAEVYSNAGRFGSVSELAREVSLSPSRFQKLYREQFGVSCYEDLLSAKVKAAQYYLKNSSLTIKEIAAVCGYENDVCFMRLFKKRTGMTPGEYRGR